MGFGACLTGAGLLGTGLLLKGLLVTGGFLVVRAVGKMGLCRFFQMIPTTAAMAPRTTRATVTPMATAVPVDRELKPASFEEQ